jgi:hypothetical protein
VAAASPSGVIPVTEHDCFIHFDERLLRPSALATHSDEALSKR